MILSLFVLINLIKVMSPFVPEFTETVYQNLVRSVYKDAPISVHLCDYPKADKSLIDEKLNEEMQEIIAVAKANDFTFLFFIKTSPFLEFENITYVKKYRPILKNGYISLVSLYHE